MYRGYFAALAAYIFWGLSPIYWKLLDKVPAFEILNHRIIWSLPFLLLLVVTSKYSQIRKKIKANPRKVLVYVISALLLAVNWFTYVWAVNSGFIVEASLGYFINPLVNVFLGVLFLKERLRTAQVLALILALGGVGYLTFNYGHFPWVALTLAFSFGLYGLIRKTGMLDSLEGLTTEMAILFLPAVIILGEKAAHHTAVFMQEGWLTFFMLFITGIFTALPLIWFAYGARRVTLTSMGFMQYIAPTLQFALGVFIYHEEFTFNRLIGFTFIWSALILYSFETVYVLNRRRNQKLGST